MFHVIYITMTGIFQLNYILDVVSQAYIFLSNYMEHSSSEFNNLSSSQEISRLLWNLTFR
jgi:hypothetical protein